MTILPITRRYFNQVTSSPDITFTILSTLDIPLPPKFSRFRYFEIPGVGVFRNLPGIRKIIAPSTNIDILDVNELEKSEIVVDNWEVKILGTNNIYPRNFYSRLSEISEQGKTFDGSSFKFPEDSLIKIVNDAYGREIKAEEKETRFTQLSLIDTTHRDEISCTIQEIREYWGGHYVHFLTKSDIDLPLNIIDSMTDRMTALSIISLKYDG